jgi:hypothetical protein
MAVLRKGVASRRMVLMSTVFVLAACESSNATDSPAASPSVRDESQTAIAVPSPTPIGDQGTKLLKYFGTYTSDRLGQIELTGILDIEGYHTVNLEILAGYADQVPDLRVTVDMGKITGSTLADEVDRFTIAIPDIHIHTYPVIGPELVVWVLGAPPNTDVDIQAWVFLN